MNGDLIQVEVPGAGPIMRPVHLKKDYIDGFVMPPPGTSRPYAIVFVPVVCNPRGKPPPFVQSRDSDPIAYKLEESGGLWFTFHAPRAWLFLKNPLHWMAFLVFDGPARTGGPEQLAAGAAATFLAMDPMPREELRKIAPPSLVATMETPDFHDATLQPTPAILGAVSLAVLTRQPGELTRGLLDRSWATGVLLGRSTEQTTLTFAVGSCRYPPGFLDRTPSRAPITLERLVQDRSHPTPLVGNADKVLAKLLERFTDKSAEVRPRLLLLIGDQIYADATAGLFDPATLTDSYRSQYRTLFGEGVSRVLFNQVERVHFMLDDHEIADNWEPHSADPKEAQKELKKPLDAFAEAQLFGRKKRVGGRFDFDFDLTTDDGTPFRLLDSRTQRQWRTAATWETAQIFDQGEQHRVDGQWAGLEQWLEDTRDAPVRFIAFPALLLPRHLWVIRQPESGLREDNWDGYPASREKLLAMLIEMKIQNAVFLSGDEHIPIAANILMTRLDAQATPIRAYSFHCSAIYAPYPFANSIPEHFVPRDSFEIQADGGRWQVETTAAFPDVGDNVAIFTLDRSQEPPTLEIVFQPGQQSLKEAWKQTVTLGEPIPFPSR